MQPLPAEAGEGAEAHGWQEDGSCGQLKEEVQNWPPHRAHGRVGSLAGPSHCVMRSEHVDMADAEPRIAVRKKIFMLFLFGSLLEETC